MSWPVRANAGTGKIPYSASSVIGVEALAGTNDSVGQDQQLRITAPMINHSFLPVAPSRSAILESPHHASTGRRPDAEIRAVVQTLLDREVNRSLAGHGGKISIVDVQDGNLFIAMSGGCQGCAASQVTLRQGLEVMVRGVAPEIVDIVDTTDHVSGKNPFYERVG